ADPVNLFRATDELETLRSDLRAVQRDLRALTRDIGGLSEQAWRARGTAGDWLQRRTGIDLSSSRAGEQAAALFRDQGVHSAEAVRKTLLAHPVAAALGVLAVGVAALWLMTRSSSAR